MWPTEGWSDVWGVGLLVLQAVGLPSRSAFRCGQLRQDVSAGTVFLPNGYKDNFREQHIGRKPAGDPSVREPVFGRAPCVTAPRKPVKANPRAKQNNPEETAQRLNPDMVLPVLEALGLPGELLEEVRRRIPVPKPPEKKKERALADLRDKLEKEKKHLERLASHAEKKRQEAEEAMHKHAVKQHEVDALELEVEQARVTAMVPTPVPTPVHVSPVPSPQQSDAESAGCEDAAISDLDLAFENDRGSNKKPQSGASSTATDPSCSSEPT